MALTSQTVPPGVLGSPAMRPASVSECTREHARAECSDVFPWGRSVSLAWSRTRLRTGASSTKRGRMHEGRRPGDAPGRAVTVRRAAGSCAGSSRSAEFSVEASLGRPGLRAAHCSLCRTALGIGRSYSADYSSGSTHGNPHMNLCCGRDGAFSARKHTREYFHDGCHPIHGTGQGAMDRTPQLVSVFGVSRRTSPGSSSLCAAPSKKEGESVGTKLEFPGAVLAVRRSCRCPRER